MKYVYIILGIIIGYSIPTFIQSAWKYQFGTEQYWISHIGVILICGCIFFIIRIIIEIIKDIQRKEI
jgi:TRAP-type C4-dicarboxylate transport system permease small subunit